MGRQNISRVRVPGIGLVIKSTLRLLLFTGTIFPDLIFKSSGFSRY